jgi:tetratricopeptide (TPR) repeat protein
MTYPSRHQRRLLAAAVALSAFVAVHPPLHAAETWVEVKSAHFTVVCNAGQGTAKNLAWQLEQIRSAIATLYPWAKVDLQKPMAVFGVKDESAMKALAPKYWELKGAVHPATVWVTGPDQYYMAIRTDVSAESQGDVNPYFASYFSYVSLILQQSLERDMPPWFMRGLAGVLSNTVVRESKILLGPPIPWHLDHLRDASRFKLAQLIAVPDNSPDLLNGESLSRFDAQAWAFVHFLMFAEGGARWGKLDQFAKMVSRGADPATAFREAIGSPEDLESPFVIYINRSLFSYRQVNVDASVKPEGFTVRALPPADIASRRALFHTAMNRPVEARAAIVDARKAGAAPDTDVAEALLLEREGKTDEAKAAYQRATSGGTTIEYAYYRLASLLWPPNADPEQLKQVEALLARAIDLNIRDPWAYAAIGEVRALRGSPGDPMAMVLRAISLDPAQAHHHLRAASVLWRQKKYDEALSQAQAARDLAKDEATRRRATEMIDGITRAKR